MDRPGAVAMGGVVLAVVLWAGPAGAVGDVENHNPKMVGAGRVVVDGSGTAQVHAHLPCPGAEVGFNPQPDPPGRSKADLEVQVGDSRFTLTALETTSCTEGGHEGTGAGLCNGETEVMISWRLADGTLGGPDTRPDSVHLEIRRAGETHGSDACTLALSGPLRSGNLQMIGQR